MNLTYQCWIPYIDSPIFYPIYVWILHTNVGATAQPGAVHGSKTPAALEWQSWASAGEQAATVATCGFLISKHPHNRTISFFMSSFVGEKQSLSEEQNIFHGGSGFKGAELLQPHLPHSPGTPPTCPLLALEYHLLPPPCLLPAHCFSVVHTDCRMADNGHFAGASMAPLCTVLALVVAQQWDSQVCLMAHF